MKKYITYLNERFPLQSHIPLIAIFSFSAICYSLSAVGTYDFIPFQDYICAFHLTITTFFLLRISDEFKDHEDDMKYRTYLPVPRGLISLNELKAWAVITIVSQLIILYLRPAFIPFYAVAIIYMILMFKEFFIPELLKKHQIAYVFSHMLIIPIVDIMASSAHWSMAGISPPKTLIWFFFVSFFNGMVLEFGRKIKTQDMEEEGVVSYTKLYGIKGGVVLWISTLTLTLLLAIFAAIKIDSATITYILLVAFYLMALVPGILFMMNPSKKRSKYIEMFSGIWTLGMYLNIGALPFILKYIT